MTDHDQLLKSFLKSFLAEFFAIFFPDWAARFDFSHVEWLDQEVFPDPPDGSRHVVDLVAKLKTKHSMGPDAGRPSDKWLSLIHVEIESADSVNPLRERMHWYWSNLRERHKCPVLPLAVYLNVGLQGLGVDSYGEDFGPLDVLRFKYLYVGMPALNGIEYLKRGDEVAASLITLMRVPDDQLPVAAWAAQECVAQSERTEQEKFLLLRMIETYLQFRTPDQEQAYLQLKNEATYREASQMAVTTYDKGVAEGRQQGLEQATEQATQRQREMVAALLVKKFHVLPANVRERLDELSFDDLTDLYPRIFDAASLDELQLP
jgi:hypothetical protein